MSAIDDYLVGLEQPQRALLEKIRKVIKQLAPDAAEAVTYGVPGFKYKDHFFIGYSAHSGFLSLYPASSAIEVYKDRLKGYKLSKGVIRFTPDNPIPDDLLKDIVMFRYKQVLGK